MDEILEFLTGHTGLIVSAIAAVLLSTGCVGEPIFESLGAENDDPTDIETEQADQVTLAADGTSQMPIVIGNDAGSSTEIAAEELATTLEEISGASFEVTKGAQPQGIVLGTPEDFDTPPLSDVSFGDGVFEREDYVLRSTTDSMYVLGATPLAARFAVWDLLYRFGHRQFFPTENWEVVPEKENLSIAVDVREEPDYYSRRAPRGGIRMDKRPWAEENWYNWQIRNRTTPTFELSTGHVYDSVIQHNQSAFDNNPEYWGLVDGERTSEAQPNVSHPDVQQMFVDYALEQLEQDPSRDSVAMDPRDGNEWSEDPESRQIGTPSDQAVFLANLVAEAVVENYGDDKYVGMYGYSHHSPPPDIDVHPNVIVSLATSYIRDGYTFDDMLEGWSERANMIGIGEYYGLFVWNESLPGDGAHAADPEYLRETIPYFYEQGARFMNAESNTTFGGYGLGYYLATRLLWDVDEADRVDELIDDFLERAFGPAKEPMTRFYELIDGSAEDPYAPGRPRPLNDDMVGRMYRQLEQARQMASDNDGVRARIDDLILYTRYVDLYRRFDVARPAERQEAFDRLVSYAWRIRDRMMVDSLELVYIINGEVKRDDNLEWGAGYSKVRPADRHRVDEDQPVTGDEIRQFLQEGIANHDLLELDFEPWTDSGELVPAGFEPTERAELPEQSNRKSLEAVMYTDDGTLPELTMSAGHIYQDRGPLRWTLIDGNENVVDQGEVPPDEQDHRFALSAPTSGVYRFTIENTKQGFVWDYDPRGAKVTLLADSEHGMAGNWYDRLYYYVPEGTDEIMIAGSMREGRYLFVDGSGDPVDPESIEVVQNYTRVPVPQGSAGEVWSLEIQALRPDIRLLNIPGYMALSPQELLLPREVVAEVE